MENNFLSVSEWAQKYGYETASVRQMLIAGRLKGFKVGKQWVIPADAVPPEDSRVKSGKYRNWRKKSSDAK